MLKKQNRRGSFLALIAVAVWLVAWLLPACWRLAKRAWRALTGKKEA